jgi:type II secretory pathway component HofQ
MKLFQIARNNIYLPERKSIFRKIAVFFTLPFVCLFSLSIYPSLIFSGGYSLVKFKDADIKVVLQSIAQKATKNGRKVNIVVSPKVEGLVTVNLESVDWQTALKGVLDAYGYSYKWSGDNIVLVATVDEIKEKDIQEKERQEIEVPKLKLFKLKYLDANDAKKSIESLLSP